MKNKPIAWGLGPDGQTPVAIYNYDNPEAQKLVQETENRKQILNTVFTDSTFVSTIFLTIDHNFNTRGHPLLWETMAFKKGDTGHEMLCERYTSRHNAVAGHFIAIAETLEMLLGDNTALKFQIRRSLDGLVHITTPVRTTGRDSEDFVEAVAICGALPPLAVYEENEVVTCVTCIANKPRFL